MKYILDEEFDETEELTVEQFEKLSKVQTENSDHKIKFVREYGPGLILYKSSTKKGPFINNTIYVYKMDRNLDTVERENINRFLQNVISNDSAGDYIGTDIADTFSETFWDSPTYLFHGTSEENAESILKKGLIPSYSTRGLNNRTVGDAIFTNSNEDLARDYGEVVFKIDTIQMKKDGYMPEVEMEPEALESEHNSILYHMFDMEYVEEYSDSGIDRDTIIFYERIPAKYLMVV